MILESATPAVGTVALALIAAAIVVALAGGGPLVLPAVAAGLIISGGMRILR